jgi:hypothetical protein
LNEPAVPNAADPQGLVQNPTKIFARIRDRVIILAFTRELEHGPSTWRQWLFVLEDRRGPRGSRGPPQWTRLVWFGERFGKRSGDLTIEQLRLLARRNLDDLAAELPRGTLGR